MGGDARHRHWHWTVSSQPAANATPDSLYPCGAARFGGCLFACLNPGKVMARIVDWTLAQLVAPEKSCHGHRTVPLLFPGSLPTVDETNWTVDETKRIRGNMFFFSFMTKAQSSLRAKRAQRKMDFAVQTRSWSCVWGHLGASGGIGHP